MIYIEKIKIGIVGLGSVAKNLHLPVLSSFPDVIIEAAAEKDIERGQKTATKWPIPNLYTDYNDMYEHSDIEGVFILLPNFLHYNAVKGALKNDLHVFCEKPMGLNPAESAELVKMAEKKDLILAVGYNRRLEENYQKTREIIQSHTLGKITQFNGIYVNLGPYSGWIPSSDWFFNDKYGVLFDSGPHLIDLILFILDDNIVEVSASGSTTLKGMDVFDNIAGSFKTQKGTVGTFNIGWQAGSNYDSVEIHGTGGSFFADKMEYEFRPCSHGPIEKISDNFHSTTTLIKKFIAQSGRGELPEETFFMEDKSFLNAIKSGKKPCVSGREGLKVLEVLDAITVSLNEKRVVKVKKTG